MKLGELLTELRFGGNVSRYHCERTIRTQRVSEHSHGVAVILCFITEPSVNLLKAALFHDLNEKRVGDMPAPIKWANPKIQEFLDEAGKKADKELEISVKLSAVEETLLKIADYLEAAFFCLEERTMGNCYVNPIMANLIWFFHSRTDFSLVPALELKAIFEMLDYIKTSYEQVDGNPVKANLTL